MVGFREQRDALQRTVLKVWPNARPTALWAGIDGWAAPRPAAAVAGERKSGYDPAVTVVGIADRKAGPTIYFLDPGDYFALETHRKLLDDAGFAAGRGCIYWTHKAPMPTRPLETLFRRVKARDAKARTRPPPASKATNAMTVDEYLAALAPDQRKALARLRAQVRKAAPAAQEKMSYGMPTWTHEGHLVYMAAFQDHLSFFPGSSGVTLALKEKLTGFTTAKGTIRFTPGTPLPAALVARIVKLRVAENEARAARRKARARAGAPRR